MSPKTFEEILSPTPGPLNPANPAQRTHTNPALTPAPTPKTDANEETPSSIPFQTALQRLSATLAEALAFFNHLEHSFTRATDPIRAHVGRDVLDRIWGSTVAGARDKGGCFYLGGYGHGYGDGHGDMNMDMDMDMDTDTDTDTGYTCIPWMQKLATRIEAFFTNKPKPKPKVKTKVKTRLKPPTAISILLPPSTFHDHLTRLQKDLDEALTARWPRGAKHDGLLDPNLLADELLLPLCCVYNRVCGLVGLLRADGELDVLATVHTRFVCVLGLMELLQIELGQSGMFWE